MSMMMVPWLRPCVEDTELTVWAEQDWWKLRELEFAPTLTAPGGEGQQCTVLPTLRDTGCREASPQEWEGTPQTRHCCDTTSCVLRASPKRSQVLQSTLAKLKDIYRNAKITSIHPSRRPNFWHPTKKYQTFKETRKITQ